MPDSLSPAKAWTIRDAAGLVRPPHGARPRDAATARASRLWPTLVVCSLVLLGFGAALADLTDGFARWTFEDLRRVEASEGRLSTGPLPVVTSQGRAQLLWPAHDGHEPVRLLEFVYTRCEGVCRSLGSAFAQMQARSQAAGSPAAGPVQLVSLSFDATHDGPAELATYARSQRADPRWWTVAVPSSGAATATLLQRLRVVAIPDGAGGYVHNGAIHLVDGDGVVRGIYGIEQWREAWRDAQDLARRARP